MINIKKGAMFGLDARIALAIFGALSVISGAALYSAIQDAKVTEIITSMNEISKAYDAYYLDTGEELDVKAHNAYLDIHSLISSSKDGWKGPYLPYEATGTHGLAHPVYGSYLIEEVKADKWTDTTQATWATNNCVNGTGTGVCYVWMVVNAIDTETVNAVNKKIDNDDDLTDGNVRLIISTGGTNYLFIKHRASNRY